MKKSLFIAAATLATALACFAEEAAVEDTVPENAEIEAKSVGDMMDEYLNAKGWSEGRNRKGTGTFFVALGRGIIQAQPGAPNYIDSRVNAYNKAMLAAKSAMAEYLETEIKTFTKEQAAEGNVAESVIGKVASEDEAATKAVFGALKQAAKEAADAGKTVNLETYEKLISTYAKAQVLGMQACCTFEGIPKDAGKGEIGVIAIWSPKLHAMARCISSGGKPPAGIGGKPIREQIPEDKLALLSTFGIQQRIDENGDLVIVAFGQAGAISASAMSAKAAEDKARMNALAAIREFAGESVAVATDFLNAESAAELENAAETYENDSGYAQRITAEAEALAISGVSTVKRAMAKHPLTGQTVAMVVCAWCPRQAAEARKIKSAVESGTALPQPPCPTSGNGSGLSNAGVPADDAAF